MLIRVPLSWLREYVDVTIPVDRAAGIYTGNVVVKSAATTAMASVR